MRRVLSPCAAIGVVALVAAPAHAQAPPAGRAAVYGTVTADGRPLAGVRITRLLAPDTAFSDSLGRYRLGGLRAGRHIFEFRKRGYAPMEAEINFPNDTIAVRADVPMTSAAAADAELMQKLEREGFVERRRAARERDRVTFLGPEDLAERDAAQVSQLFENVPDVTVRFENGISVLYGAGGHCVMQVWIEHQLIETAFPPTSGSTGSSFTGGGGGRRGLAQVTYTGLDRLMPITQIGAVEIYPRASLVPQQFRGASLQVAQGQDFETRNADCGAVVFWTR